MINISIKMQSPFIFLISYITLLSTVFHHLECQARDSIISGGYPLIDSTGETLVSKGKRFKLGFFTPDGNEKGNRYIGIWYNYDRDPRVIVWVAGRDAPLPDASGVFGIKDDGIVKLWNRDKLFWSATNVADTRNLNRTLKLLDSGNLILFDGGSSGASLWQSFDHPTDTFIPGMQMDGKSLTSWISPSDPATGLYSFLQDQNVYSIKKISTDYYWKSHDAGSLNIYNDVPNYVDQMLGGLDQTNGQLLADRTTYIRYNFSKHAVYNNVTRVLMNSSGLIQYFEGDDYGGWSLRWSEPNDRCKVYEPCGNSANCDSKSQPICQCLPGFKPQFKEDWDLGRYSGGCVKEESISCQEDADIMKQFLNLPVKKVESTNAQRFDIAGKNTTCERECLSDCKCRAYLSRSDNITSRETGENHLYCWIWTQDLTNLQIGDNRDDNRISIRSPDTKSTRNCQPCFLNQIPYPLSSGPDCGDPLYRGFSCDNSTGVISFLTLSGKYPVIGIHKATNSFVIQQNSEGDVGCKTGNISIQNLKLDQSSPFTVTNPCYIEPGNAIPDVQVGNQIEISWRIPMEPMCNYSGDCKDWPNSYCQDKGDGQKRCYCNRGYKWEEPSVSCIKASTNIEGGPENKKHMKYVIVSVVSVAGIVLILCCLNIVRRTRLFKGEGNIEEKPVIFSHEYEGPVDDLMNIEKDSTKAIDVPFYSLDIVSSSTDKFSDANKLGRGGFGSVYKGKFPGGQEIAVKRLSSCSGQGIKEFQNEVVLISKLQHRNLVRLLGYSLNKHEKLLLYEYMPNRSLDAFIFDQENRLLLDWKKRFDIILGIARGLLYLHQDSRLRVIHRDLKTSNILLDENMNPKISDFGLARIVEGRAEASTKNVIGTLGYMSPEYALEGKFSTKSDVFSFGVVLLEIVSGKKNTGFYNPEQVLNLLRYAWILWTENKALDLTDPTLVETCDASQVMKCINIGLLCVQEDPGDRPTMSNVVVMLDSETSPLPPTTQPAFVVRRRLSVASSSSSSKPETISNNELTITMDEGR
ncbi:G-type lectin S-receptor-like serine/threonine-protein kinase At4g03230 isoform X1 [Primulina huaijiensis]|uniref:G-type lectin S-receptor-like serine/threonine-protein kinase At4g03230 isoform X1 n=1 Tax=Primulina huaijiensis TaxID=1492673 RepID=UPI003CC74304